MDWTEAARLMISRRDMLVLSGSAATVISAYPAARAASSSIESAKAAVAKAKPAIDRISHEVWD